MLKNYSACQLKQTLLYISKTCPWSPGTGNMTDLICANWSNLANCWCTVLLFDSYYVIIWVHPTKIFVRNNCVLLITKTNLQNTNEMLTNRSYQLSRRCKYWCTSNNLRSNSNDVLPMRLAEKAGAIAHRLLFLFFRGRRGGILGHTENLWQWRLNTFVERFLASST